MSVSFNLFFFKSQRAVKNLFFISFYFNVENSFLIPFNFLFSKKRNIVLRYFFNLKLIFFLKIYFFFVKRHNKYIIFIDKHLKNVILKICIQFKCVYYYLYLRNLLFIVKMVYLIINLKKINYYKKKILIFG